MAFEDWTQEQKDQLVRETVQVMMQGLDEKNLAGVLVARTADAMADVIAATGRFNVKGEDSRVKLGFLFGFIAGNAGSMASEIVSTQTPAEVGIGTEGND